jgi:hypothetical protein
MHVLMWLVTVKCMSVYECLMLTLAHTYGALCELRHDHEAALTYNHNSLSLLTHAVTVLCLG